MYDRFISAPGRQDIDIKKNQRRLSSDVFHTHDRIVSLAGLWTFDQRCALDSGE
jgi:hypothetical protein